MARALLALAVVAWVAGYGVACWIWPFANCPRCKGTGKLRSPSGRAFRLCKRCNRTGRRLRFGRRVYNLLRTTQKDAS